MADRPVTTDAATAQASTDKLEDIETPVTPDTEDDPDAPEYRADVARGEWRAPPSKWRVGEKIHVKKKNGDTAGPFTIIECHRPTNRNERWRYDIQDDHGNIKRGVSTSHLV